MKNICIIGGGISGLTVAYEQKNAGNQVKLLESNDQVGGVIQSKKANGFLLDYGANTLNVRLKTTKSFLIGCKAWDDCIDANPQASKRMIIRDGKIVDLPHSFASFITSPFLSMKGKLRLFCEPFISRAKNAENETVASFISRRLGKEALDYAGNPFLAGIYAAKPESLNLKQAFPKMWEIEDKYRSLFLGFRKKSRQADNPNLKKPRLVSFAQGMEELPQKLGSFLSEEIFCNQTVKKISRNANDWNIDIQMQSGEIYTETFDQIISTIPSHKILSLKWENIKGIEELDTLASSKHFPLALVYLGFKKEDVNHPLDGFGFLVPEVERLNILGTLFSSTLFPGRAPDGQVLLTTFVGGERNPELAKLPVQKLVNLVQNELSKVLGINAKPCFQEVKLWPQAIPLPDLEMGNRKNAAEKLSKLNPGLSFSGSYLSGASLPNCLEAS
jgi:oxygen-dependent protoporphyrinogen oxidase